MKSVMTGLLCLMMTGLAGCGASPKSFRPSTDVAEIVAPTPAPAPAVAIGDLLDRINPQDVTGTLDLLGFEYRLGLNDLGEPVVGILPSQPSDSQEVYILFNRCDGENRCDDITLVSFDPERRPIHLEMINRWNRDNRFQRAFIDPQFGPVLQMDINGGGGLGPDALTRQMSSYFAAMDRFAATLDIV